MDQAAQIDLYAQGAWLFDADFYFANNRDLTPERLQKARFASALDHYRRIGDREGRSASLFFDSRFYLAQLPSPEAREAAAEGAFHHYLRTREEGGPERRTSAYFNPDFYQSQYGGTALHGALHHYLTNNTPTEFDPLEEFSENFYLANYPDVMAAVKAGAHRCGYMHFLLHGAQELRRPRKDIDLSWYIRDNESARTDLANRRVSNAFVHFLMIGRPAGLRAGPAVRQRPDPAEAEELFTLRARAMLPGLVRRGLDFGFQGTPSVTVIVVTRDHFLSLMVTLGTLRAAYAGAIELLVLDLGSDDETGLLEQFVAGVRLLRFGRETDRLHALSAAIPCASATQILLLNDKVELMPGALDLAMRRMDQDDSVGAVGALVLGVDGAPAEAGGTIGQDGTISVPIPESASLAVREVDVCSADFLLLRAEALKTVSSTDEQEATEAGADLCVKIRDAGQRVVCDPAVVVQRMSVEPERTTKIAARVPARPIPLRRRILFIDDTVPLRSLGSGFVRSNDLVRTMLTLGCAVTVFPLGPGKSGPATLAAETPDEAEVILDGDTGELKRFLRSRGQDFDVIWIARTHNLQLVRPALESVYPDREERPLIVLDTEAIASRRAAARARVTGEAFDLDAAQREEFGHAAFCDRFVAVCAQEARVLTELGLKPVSVIGHALPTRPTRPPFGERSGLLFLGAIHEPGSPNHDALSWFISSVLPLIEKELGWETMLTVAGYAAPGVLAEEWSHHPRVTLIGTVGDVMPLYQQHRVFIAPTRFAAGLPYKLHEAASFGLPAVTTSLLAGQLGWTDGKDILAADPADAAGFAARVVRLYRDEALWLALREAALIRLAQDAAYEPFRAALNRVARGVAPHVATAAGD